MATRAMMAGMPMTEEEYFALGEDPPGVRLELSEGRLIVAPSSNFQHNDIARRLCNRLDDSAKPRRLGRATTETEMRLGPATLRRPDVSFFRTGRLRGLPPTTQPLPCPDLAFEILSPSNRRSDLLLEVKQLLDAGASAVWFLDPKTETAERHAPDSPPETRPVFEKPSLLPGLRITLDEIFAPGREPFE